MTARIKHDVYLNRGWGVSPNAHEDALRLREERCKRQEAGGTGSLAYAWQLTGPARVTWCLITLQTLYYVT